MLDRPVHTRSLLRGTKTLTERSNFDQRVPSACFNSGDAESNHYTWLVNETAVKRTAPEARLVALVRNLVSCYVSIVSPPFEDLLMDGATEKLELGLQRLAKA